MRLSTLAAAVLLLISNHAFTQIQSTIAALRANGAASITTPYFITDPGREGLFFYDANDRYTLDNAGTIIVSGTKRYKRSYSGALDIRWFGGKADWNGTSGSDNTAAINAAFSAALPNQTVMIPGGKWYIGSTISLPIVTTKRVPVEIFGDVFMAKGAGFIIEGVNQDFRAHGLISGGNAAATTESAYSGYAGTAIYLKNTFSSRIEVNEICNFRYGIMQAGDKSGGTPTGAQYNQIFFTIIHNCYYQIFLTTFGNTSGKGNWNNESFWYGGQLGKGTPGVTYGAGGWYGLVVQYSAGSTPGFTIDGHMFHNVGFEGLEKATLMKNCSGFSFLGGGIEPDGVHAGFDMDPITCVGTKFVGYTALYETNFVAGRLGTNTSISATPFWVGPATARNYGGNEAVSISASRWLVTAPKYSVTNFSSNNTSDFSTVSGPIPALQAMSTRVNGVLKYVPFKSTFLHVTASTAGSPIALPANIGCVRVEANQAKIFKIDVGDLAAFGEGFFVEYVSANYPISFVRSDNSAVLIPTTSFPTAGTYKCTYAMGVFKVALLSQNYFTFTQTGAAYNISDGIATHFVNYPWGAAIATLPAASLYPGREITVKNLQAAKTVQVVGVNAADENIMQGRGSMTVKSDGTTWNVISFYKKALTY